MARGGRREGAGGKSTWNYGKTKVVRVPENLAELVLQIAREIDSGKPIIVSVTQSGVASALKADAVTESKVIDLSGVSIRAFKDGPGVYLADLLAAGYEIRPERITRSVKLRSSQQKQERAISLKRELDTAIEQLSLFDSGI